ncbi:MAG: hypothetical protein AMXMBFR78_34930 [Rubrivivax sp.]
MRLREPAAAIEEAGEAVGRELLARRKHLAHRQAVDRDQHDEPRRRRRRAPLDTAAARQRAAAKPGDAKEERKQTAS